VWYSFTAFGANATSARSRGVAAAESAGALSTQAPACPWPFSLGACSVSSRHYFYLLSSYFLDDNVFSSVDEMKSIISKETNFMPLLQEVFFYVNHPMTIYYNKLYLNFNVKIA
jgi:hypothetical protein